MSFILQYQQAVATVPVGFTSASKYGMDYYIPITKKEHNAHTEGCVTDTFYLASNPDVDLHKPIDLSRTPGTKLLHAGCSQKQDQLISMLNCENLAPGHPISSLNWSICR